jgi:menaquinone-9 beta-reductase
MYDVIIVGGSFAGLAVAMQLRGHRVLLIDQRPIGACQTSTCAIPLRTAQAVGAERAIQEAHAALLLHTGGREIPFPQREAYVTFDYAAFCRAMLAQTEVEVWQERATALSDTEVATSRGVVQGRFVVDASGWKGLRAPAAGPARDLGLGYGVETELPGPSPAGPHLHFYYEQGLVRNGYAWVFPCGDSVRIGVCSFDPGVALGPVLAAHLARFGLRVGRTHGGALATRSRPPLVEGRFVVGDAAGQCLPLTAEGIRPALASGAGCGRLIAAALAGALAPDEARAQYAAYIEAGRRPRRGLQRMEATVAGAPDHLRAVAGRIAAQRTLHRGMMGWYHETAGGLAATSEEFSRPPARLRVAATRS